MLPEQQQRILGYFIEEARDHLSTIEQGLLNLQNTLNDSEMVNEIFRAAHSIKGGAAMLGLNSIQRTAHRFEDFFKVLKECQSIQIDQNIESLFLRMFDNLQALLDQLQSESGLTEDVANRLMSEVEPVFVTLEQHLESRVHQAGGTMQLEESFTVTLTQPSTPAITASAVSVFQNSVPEILRQMLQVFKQPETPQTRQQLEQLCNQLAQLGEQFNLSGWCTLCETTAGAIANLDNTYRILAPIVIKEIKQAQELVLADRPDAIATCEQLQALSLKTFSSDWDTDFESQDKQLAQTVEVAQQTAEEFNRKFKNGYVDSELLVIDQEQFIDWTAEDNLSSLFALNSNDNNQVCQQTSDILDFNIEDGLENSLITHSKDNLPLISSEETLALNSLFGQAQDTSLDLTQAEAAFCDLFNAPEADLENIDLLEVSTAASKGNSNLSSLWAEEPDTPPQIELDIKELSFSLGADDLIASSEESFTLPIVTSDANDDVDSHIDFALSNSSEPKQKFDNHWFVEPEADLTTILECNLSSGFNEFSDTAVDVIQTPTPAPEITTDVESNLISNDNDLFSVIAEIDPSLDIFEQPGSVPSVELDFSLDSNSTDSFNTGDTQSNLELFETPVSAPSEELDFSLDSTSIDLFEAHASAPSVDNSAELIAGFDSSAEQLDYSLGFTSTDLFSTEESESNLELFEAPVSTLGEELDFSLDSSCTDLFSTGESESNLELFETCASGVSEKLDFSLDSSSTNLFSPEETESSLDLFEQPASSVSEELDFSLDSTSTDLFSTNQTQSNLELFEAPVSALGEELDFSLDSTSTDLFNTGESELSLDLFEACASSEELDFSLDSTSTDLFSTNQTQSNLELFEASASSEELDFSLDSTSTDLFSTGESESNLELFEACASSVSEKLDFSLDSSSTDLFSPEETESSLDLFEQPASSVSEELDFNLDSTSTELFSLGESESNLKLFETPVSAPSEELDLSVDSTSTDLFSTGESESNLELFEACASSVSEKLDVSLDSTSTDLFSTGESESNLELFEACASSVSEKLDFSLDSFSTDLFSPEETESSLDLFETSASSEELDFNLDSTSTDLFSTNQTQSNLELFEAPVSASSEELDFSLDSTSTDLFSTGESESNLELFETPVSAPSEELDFSLDSTSTDLFSTGESESNLELFEACASSVSEKLDISLDSSSTDLFSPEETESSLDLFEQPVSIPSEELDFSLDSSSTDLFTTEEIQSNSELFEASAPASSVENTPELMAKIDLINSTEMALEHELNRLDMGVEQIPSQTKYFHEDLPESIVFDLEVEGELPTEIASVADDFAQLEALLEEESTSNAVAQAEPQLDLNTVAPVIKAVPESSNDEFDDLEKLLHETPTTPASPAPPKPQQKQAATNSRRSAFEQMMRVPVKQLDSISNQVGELVVYRNSLEQDQERLRQFLDNLLHQVQQLSDVGSRMQELYERSLVEASLVTSRPAQTVFDTAPAPKGHVTGINFDALEMDRFTSFHTLAQEMIELIVRVREASSDIEFVTGETEQVARQFRQVTTQLQEGITRSRMVPFSQIAERLPRAVRDISLKYGKQAELQIEGKETLIDKVILEQLYDPMTHLVNNAITHGIESSEDRSLGGKSPVGQITIRAFHQGNQTIITISDDGAGIDPERVKAKAIENGLITPEAANNMSRLDVYNLLFQAGFSTKDSVDEFAGRGVGMDVVLTSLSQIRGTITTDSTLGKGTTFTIRLPLTLSICKALCCLSDKARIAFPMDGVEQMMDVPVESVITNAQGQSCIPWRDSLLPFRHLREYLTLNRQISRGTIYGSNRDDNMISVVVLRSADIFFAIQVDQVLGEQEIVIKQFEAPAPKPVGIAGATILGDGRIMPIADVLELIDLSMGRIRHNIEGTWWTASDTSLPPITTAAARTEPMVLIIDDSITVRELLSMTFVNAGYRVEQARDGQEAWDKLRDGLPCDLIFCDIEMPRMDGLELLSRMQQDDRLSQLPIAMLTSRGSDRHRQMALQLGASGYFTKPYLEEALLDGAQRMLKGEVLLAGQRLSD